MLRVTRLLPEWADYCVECDQPCGIRFLSDNDPTYARMRRRSDCCQAQTEARPLRLRELLRR